MSVTQGLPTARIPELTDPTPYLSQLSLTEDRIPYWIATENKLVKLPLVVLQQLFQGGGGTPLPGATNGNKILYIVPTSDVGNTQYNNASIAGKDFNLTQEGRPMIKGVEYEVLSAGGFRLLQPGDTFQEFVRYEIELFELTGNGGGGGTTSSLFTGAYEATVNVIMDSTHLNKLLQIRGGSSKVKVTLTDIENTPANTIVVIETMVSNDRQTEVATKNGQNIYMNGKSYKSLYMGIGESLMLYRGANGWYVINDFGANYRGMARPYASYEVGLNELVCDGSLVSRTEYARLFELVQTLGYSYIDEAAWQIASQTDSAGNFVENPYRGCFSNGTDGTNFRLPDLRNQFIRGLHTTDGTERFYNHAGGRQDDQIKSHVHTTGTKPPNSAGFNGGGVHTFNYWEATEKTSTGQVSTGSVGGTETRPKNVGMLWVIKA